MTILKEVKINKISSKVQKSKLRWFGHLKRRNGEAHIRREVMDMRVWPIL
jgi:hypothetical protein